MEKTRIEKITVRFNLNGNKFKNGTCYFEHEEYIGVMINGDPVFVGREYMKSEPVITDKSFSVDLPYFYIKNKKLTKFIDTSDMPSLFK